MSQPCNVSSHLLSSHPISSPIGWVLPAAAGHQTAMAHSQWHREWPSGTTWAGQVWVSVPYLALFIPSLYFSALYLFLALSLSFYLCLNLYPHCCLFLSPPFLLSFLSHTDSQGKSFFLSVSQCQTLSWSQWYSTAPQDVWSLSYCHQPHTVISLVKFIYVITSIFCD